MAITSASLLQYPIGVGVTDNGTDTTLVNRSYVTKDIYNADAWIAGNATGAKDYEVGDLVQYNGKLYTCKQGYTVANYTGGTAANFVPDKSGSAYWERTYPILHKYVGQRDNLVDVSTVTITHNLGTTDLTVQVYDYDQVNSTWVPIMVNFGFSGENAIVLNFGTNYSGTVRVVIVAAK